MTGGTIPKDDLHDKGFFYPPRVVDLVPEGALATSDLQAPFGGWKMSGMGRELGPEGLHGFLEKKHIKLRLRGRGL